jgi:hypothetical protein
MRIRNIDKEPHNSKEETYFKLYNVHHGKKVAKRMKILGTSIKLEKGLDHDHVLKRSENTWARLLALIVCISDT